MNLQHFRERPTLHAAVIFEAARWGDRSRDIQVRPRERGAIGHVAHHRVEYLTVAVSLRLGHAGIEVGGEAAIAIFAAGDGADLPLFGSRILLRGRGWAGRSWLHLHGNRATRTAPVQKQHGQ